MIDDYVRASCHVYMPRRFVSWAGSGSSKGQEVQLLALNKIPVMFLFGFVIL